MRIPAGIALSVTLNGQTQDTEGRICLDFITTVVSNWNSEETECLIITPGDIQPYAFSFEENPAWDGKVVTQLRLSAVSPSWLEIDSLQVNISGYAWEFEVPGDDEGWVAWNDMGPFTTRDGILSTRALGNDPYMHSPGVSIEAASYPIIEIRMKVSAGGDSQIFFNTEADDSFIEERSILFHPIPDSEFHTYTLDMSEVAQWQGVIRQLRIDPTNARAAIEIDYIRVLVKP